MEISCCFIVLNEEQTLGRILKCASQFADEIIVVDTGSTDNSKSIAREYTDKVYDFEWVDDFSKARNFAFSKATKPYLMWLDADDYITDENIEKIKAFKESGQDFDVAFMLYATAFDENGNATFCYKRERIVKNAPQFKFVDPIHEVIVPSGNIVHLDITIEHRKEKESDPLRNLNFYKRLKAKGVEFSPRMQFYYANELFYTEHYTEAMCEYESFLKKPAFVENQIQACLNCAQCYRHLHYNVQAYQMLYSSLVYDKPRSEVLCQLSLYLCNDGKFEHAKYWLKQAIGKPNFSSGAFILKDCYDFIPYYNLAYCEYRLKHYKKAVYYIKKALECKPNDVSTLKNYEYYKSLCDKNKTCNS